MAKYTHVIKDIDIDDLIAKVEERLYYYSSSLSKEEEESYVSDDVRVVTIAYERYSMTGGNRLTLNVTYIKDKESIYVIAMSTGGSNGVLLKFNTLGEEGFLNTFINALNDIGIR